MHALIVVTETGVVFWIARDDLWNGTVAINVRSTKLDSGWLLCGRPDQCHADYAERWEYGGPTWNGGICDSPSRLHCTAVQIAASQPQSRLTA